MKHFEKILCIVYYLLLILPSWRRNLRQSTKVSTYHCSKRTSKWSILVFGNIKSRVSLKSVRPFNSRSRFQSSIERLWTYVRTQGNFCRLLLRVSPKMWHFKAPFTPAEEMVCLFSDKLLERPLWTIDHWVPFPNVVLRISWRLGFRPIVNDRNLNFDEFSTSKQWPKCWLWFYA